MPGDYSFNSICVVISYKIYIIMQKDIDWYKDNNKKNLSANYTSTINSGGVKINNVNTSQLMSLSNMYH